MELVLCISAVCVPALTRTLSMWLIQRRSDLVITVTGQDGQRVSVSARRVKEPEKLLRRVLEQQAAPKLDEED